MGLTGLGVAEDTILTRKILQAIHTLNLARSNLTILLASDARITILVQRALLACSQEG